MKKQYAVAGVVMLVLAFIVHFLNHGLLGYCSLIIAGNGKYSFTLLGHGTELYAVLQQTVIPFLNAVTMFAVYGTLCFSVMRFGPLRSLPHIFLCVISVSFPVVFSLLALSRAEKIPFRELIAEYSEAGYLRYLGINILLGAAAAAAVCAVTVTLYFIFRRRGYADVELVTGYPMSRCLIYLVLAALIFTLISDIQETAFDIGNAGAPENGAEFFYLAEPYISLVIFAVAGYFTMRIVVHLLAGAGKFKQKSIEKNK